MSDIVKAEMISWLREHNLNETASALLNSTSDLNKVFPVLIEEIRSVGDAARVVAKFSQRLPAVSTEHTAMLSFLFLTEHLGKFEDLEAYALLVKAILKSPQWSFCAAIAFEGAVHFDDVMKFRDACGEKMCKEKRWETALETWDF